MKGSDFWLELLRAHVAKIESDSIIWGKYPHFLTLHSLTQNPNHQKQRQISERKPNKLTCKLVQNDKGLNNENQKGDPHNKFAKDQKNHQQGKYTSQHRNWKRHSKEHSESDEPYLGERRLYSEREAGKSAWGRRWPSTVQIAYRRPTFGSLQARTLTLTVSRFAAARVSSLRTRSGGEKKFGIRITKTLEDKRARAERYDSRTSGSEKLIRKRIDKKLS